MATRQFYVDIDHAKVGILKDSRLNPLTTANRTTLGGTLAAGNSGLIVYDTDLNQVFYWSGSAWVSGVAPLTGAMTYKGTYASLTVEPTTPVVGDTYLLSTAGTLTWAGITFNPSAVVQVGDIAIKRDATTYDIIQGNTVTSSETNAGDIEIATQTETNTATDDIRAITPLKLQGFATARQFGKVYAVTGNLVANTAFTVTHSLALTNQDDVVVSVKAANSEITVDVDTTSVNALTITSSVAVTNARITVIGF